MGDVLRTTVVLGAIILGLFLIGNLLFTETPDNPTSEVDYLLAASGVEDRTGFDPFVPPALDDGWRSTVASFDGNRWRLVVNTPEKQFISFEQASVSARELMMTSTVELATDESATLAGHIWSVGQDEAGNTAYFREQDDQALMVITNADVGLVDAYISSFVPFSSLD